jgi:hypothetical protein
MRSLKGYAQLERPCASLKGYANSLASTAARAQEILGEQNPLVK